MASRRDVRLADQLVEHNQAEASQYLDQLRYRIAGEVRTRVLVSDHIKLSVKRYWMGSL